MKKILGIIIMVILAIAVSLGAWVIGRKIHYSLAYENMVKKTVIEMVKPEALK